MGRELKRVPMDFDWPIDKIWDGYLTPEEFRLPQCAACGGDGYTPEARAIADTFYPHMIGGPRADELAWCDKIGQAEVDNLLAKGRLTTLVKHDPTEDNPRDWEWKPLPRIAEEVNANQRGLDSHDAINRWLLVSFRCERLGIPEKCSTCTGHGNIATDEEREEAEKDHRVDPPEGEGYQLWETTTEGSPLSPVFATIEELCTYAAANCTVFGGSTTTAEGWREMLDESYVRLEETMPNGTKAVFM
jgi:hypothetical protein